MAKDPGLELQRKERKRKQSTVISYSLWLRLEGSDSPAFKLKYGKEKDLESLEGFCLFLADRYDRDCLLPASWDSDQE